MGKNGALESRGEFFNILNHPNFAMNDVARQVFAGAVNGSGACDSRTDSARSREIQFALKLLF